MNRRTPSLKLGLIQIGSVLPLDHDHIQSPVIDVGRAQKSKALLQEEDEANHVSRPFHRIHQSQILDDQAYDPSGESKVFADRRRGSLRVLLLQYLADRDDGRGHYAGEN